MAKFITVTFLTFYSTFVFSVDINNIFQNDKQLIEKFSLSKKAKIGYKNPFLGFAKYKDDPKNRVGKSFKIHPTYLDRVTFWFSVYTVYDSNHSLFHDKKNLRIVYDVLDFTELTKSILSKHTKFAIQNRIVVEKVKEYRSAFRRLALGKKPGVIAKRIQNAIIRTNIKIPRNRIKRKKFWVERSKNFRAQTGQKDNIRQGLLNLKPYKKTIDLYFEEFNLPKELLSVPFLESSFNIHARSKVGAAGAWQFMRRVGKHFMPMNKYVDLRRNPLVSSVGGLHLLAQNKKILKHWDLAVSAYNNGAGLLLKGVRRLKKKGFKNPRLHHLLNNFKSGKFGFASKNFYSGFLALVYTLAYREDFFADNVVTITKNHPIHNIYIALCSTYPNKVLSFLRKKDSQTNISNNHFKKKYRKKKQARGTIYVTSQKLNKKYYYMVPIKKMRKRYPLNWKRYIKSYKCSTK